jgi:hypothetical protein
MQPEEKTMIELTEQQSQELKDAEPVAIDPKTQLTYVLIPKEAYERIKAHFALDDYDADEGMAHINDVMSEDDANDPLLQSYQHFGKKA